MAAFDPAFAYLMSHEDAELKGEVVKDPSRAHPDAVARFGLNSGANPDLVKEGFYTMPHDEALTLARSCYRERYWSPAGGCMITDQAIANKFFDLAVNEGLMAATKILQRAANEVLAQAGGYHSFDVDGKIGQHTLDAVNAADPAKLLLAIKAWAVRYYQEIAQANPAEAHDLNDWIRRAMS